MNFQRQEITVIDYVENKASVDQLADLYAYLNCIRLSDFTSKGIYKYSDDNLPVYIIENSDNEELIEGEYVYWKQIDEYLTKILLKGASEDIVCAYCFITL
jgi:hypothetical protein